MNGERFCEFCGSPVKKEARFCPACGQPVRSITPTGFVPESNPVIPPTQKMEEPSPPPPQYPQTTVSDPYGYAPAPPKKSNKTILIIGIAAAVFVLCMVVVVIAIGSSILGKDNGTGLFSNSTATFEPSTITEMPTLVAPAEKSLTGKQQLSQTQFFDDFSSDALEWPVMNDENFSCGYQNGGYYIEVKNPDYRQVIFSPVESLTHLEFTAEVFEGSDNGGFGVACYYQDINNFYFVYFFPGRSNYSIGRFENGAWIDLTDALPYNLIQGPQRYAVECTPGMMSVYVDGALITDYEITQPIQSNKMHLLVSTWEDSAGGMKVIFDDVSGYKAMQ